MDSRLAALLIVEDGSSLSKARRVEFTRLASPPTSVMYVCMCMGPGANNVGRHDMLQCTNGSSRVDYRARYGTPATTESSTAILTEQNSIYRQYSTCTVHHGAVASHLLAVLETRTTVRPSPIELRLGYVINAGTGKCNRSEASKSKQKVWNVQYGWNKLVTHLPAPWK